MRFFALLAALAWLLGPLPALAGAQIKGEANVDVTGTDAADAKSQAMAKGEVQALISLLDKLSASSQGTDIVATLDAKKIGALVHGTEVLEEKINGSRYRARLAVSFDADEVSALITRYSTSGSKDELPVTTTAFLIIPSFQDSNKTYLWETENPWRSAWRSLALEAITGNIVVPVGDVPDSNVVSVASMNSVAYTALSPYIDRYGVSDVVLLQAKYTTIPDQMLTVVKRRVNRTRNEINQLTYRADLQETREALLMRAAKDIIEGLETKKNEELTVVQNVRSGDRNKIMVLATITTLSSWTKLRAQLSALPMVDQVELIAMSPKQVDVVIHYRGTPDSLAAAIESQKIRLAQNKDYWVVSHD